MLIFQRYGIEQEYTLLQTNVKWPLGWPVGGYPGPQVMSLLLFLLAFIHISQGGGLRGPSEIQFLGVSYLYVVQFVHFYIIRNCHSY